MGKFFFAIILFLSCTIRANATHIFGGELLYTHLTGSTYKLTLTIYGDCSGNGSAFSGLYTASPLIQVFNNSTAYSTVSLIGEAGNLGVEVSPVCPGQINSTSCNGGTLPGVKKFVYSANITLPTDSNWMFAFIGDFQNGTTAGRSSKISNTTGAGSDVMYITSTLKYTNSNNNSPQYTTIPTPFYCINVLQ